MGVEKSCHLASGHFPALNSSPDQSLSFQVPHNLYQAGVALVHVLLQRCFQLLCGSYSKDTKVKGVLDPADVNGNMPAVIIHVQFSQVGHCVI